MEYLTYVDCKAGMWVNDKSFGDGYINQVLKTRIKVRFNKNAYDITYDKAHIKICLTKISDNGNTTP